jgi:hypothetical protein
MASILYPPLAEDSDDEHDVDRDEAHWPRKDPAGEDCDTAGEQDSGPEADGD